ncbi:MAG: tetratricopeptide repeat protein [Thermodesulfobacteria bacterium]|nr:tetratricopeptide repeat protein [Thermodesulfobacteriota bacterium]
MKSFAKVYKKGLKFLCFFLLIGFLFGCGASTNFKNTDVGIHKQLAELLIKQNQYTQALKELKLALKTNSNDPELYNLLGLAYMGKYEYDKAEKAFKKAIALKPTFSEAYTNLGALRMLEHRYEEAIKCFQKALSNPCYLNSYLALTNMGWAYYKLGQEKKALDTLLKAYQENPRYPKVLVYLGLIHLNKGELDAAKFYFKQAIKIDENFCEARYYLGEVFFREGNKQLAEELWRSVIYLAPNSEWANKATSRLYLLKNTSS